MFKASLLVAALTAVFVIPTHFAKAADSDPGYGPLRGWQSSGRDFRPAYAPLYRPTKRYYAKNGVILYDFVAAPQRTSRNWSIEHGAWTLAPSQWVGWSSPRIVLSNTPKAKKSVAPIAEAPYGRP